MLRPQDNGIREAKRLDGLWDFAADRRGVGLGEGWFRGPLPQAQPIAVPSSYNDLFVVDDVHDHVGDVWYQRAVYVPRGWAGGRVVLRFDSATHRAVVWVDEAEVVRHEGGYTPFEADISTHAVAGRELRITAVVNNELSWQSIPPGTVTTGSDGVRRQRYFHDFFNYAGLHRSVWLSTTAPTYVDDLVVTTDVDGEEGVVSYRASIGGAVAAGVAVQAELTDADGVVVARAAGATGDLVVPSVQRWQPGRGYRYTLTVELVADDGAVVDRYRQRVGVRTVRVDGARFLINDEPFVFRGFGMHEDLAIRGKGHDPAAMIHDFELLRWVGANSLRTSHYPYAEEVLDHADRLGIVVIDETAAVGLHLGVAGGFFQSAPLATFSPDTINDDTRRIHQQAIEELIARDRNHPSVVLWSIANEPESHTDAAVDYFAPLFAAARAADPTRPVGFVNIMLAPPHACRLTELADVVMVNRYYGWYVDAGDLAMAEEKLYAELTAWAARHDKPILVTEYGADTIAGLHSTRAVPWTEEYQALLLDAYHRVFDRIDAVVGEHVWNFADFMTNSSFMRVDGNRKGVFTRDRRPKAAAHLLRQRWQKAESAAP